MSTFVAFLFISMFVCCCLPVLYVVVLAYEYVFCFVYQCIFLFWLMSMFVVFLFTSECFLLFLFTSKFCYHRERESSCDGGVRERDVDLERTYRYHAVTLGVLTVAFITTTLVTIKEQNGDFFLVRLCFLYALSHLFQHFVI